MKQNTQILDLQKNQSCRPQIEIVKAMLKLVKKMYFCAQDTIILVRLLCYINRYKVQGLLVYSILKIILNTQMLSSNYKDQEYGVFRSLGTFTWLSNLLRWNNGMLCHYFKRSTKSISLHFLWSQYLLRQCFTISLSALVSVTSSWYINAIFT